MAHTVKVLYRTHLPGAGFQQDTGTAVNGKQLIVGKLDVTNYTSTGEVITPNEFGLLTIDFINFDSHEQTTSYHARWQHTNYKFRVFDLATPTEFTATNDAKSWGFIAVGDSAADPELL